MTKPLEKSAAGADAHSADMPGEPSAALRPSGDEGGSQGDPGSASMPLASVSFAIEALARGSADVASVDAIARGSFDEGDFSADKELERPWARMWVARVESTDASPSAFLVAWHV